MKVSRMVDDDHFIIIGVTNVDEQMKERRLTERMKEEQIVYTRLKALVGDFLCVYIVVPENGRYREFSTTSGYETFALEKEGPRLIVGISDIDAQVRQEEAYVKDLAQARIEANIDALNGVKNRQSVISLSTVRCSVWAETSLRSSRREMTIGVSRNWAAG